MLNPFTHGGTPADVERYKVEPYVVAADVYSAPGLVGRGGWTWYTGSASWMYRVALESLLGFSRRGDRLAIVPRVPQDWPSFTIEYRHGATVYAIEGTEPAKVGRRGAQVTLDGHASAEDSIPLVDDGARHTVVITPKAA
jgi:cyclic beta-1,2-glucan synthetase